MDRAEVVSEVEGRAGSPHGEVEGRAGSPRGCVSLPTIYLGIDPGKHGAVVVLDADGALLSWHDTPTRTTGYTAAGTEQIAQCELGTAEMLRGIVGAALKSGLDVRAAIERVGAMPHEGAVGAFSFGQSVGIWLGVLAALGVPCVGVAPATWHRQMLSGAIGPRPKDRSIAVARLRWPTMPLNRKADADRADAAHIADWGRVWWTMVRKGYVADKAAGGA